MKKYIAYCRKSTDEPDRQILSIEAQVAELEEFAERENLKIISFISESKTAKEPGREKFAEVLQFIEDGKADGILSWHPDRLARNSIDGGKIIYLLDTGSLKDLKFPTFWFDNTPQGKFMLNIAFGQSKYYVDNLSENVKRGNRQKLRRGELPGKAPFGYLNDKSTKTILVDKKRAKFVQKAFQLFSTGGYGYTDIRKFFIENKIFNTTGTPLHVDKV
jgi:DNA invertase Pin-like site-specific DNA recombinase